MFYHLYQASAMPGMPGMFSRTLLRMIGFQANYQTTIGTKPGTARNATWLGNSSVLRAVLVDDATLRLEYSTSGKAPIFSLNWASFTQQRQPIPTKQLFVATTL